jgi:hypothetical protein
MPWRSCKRESCQLLKWNVAAIQVRPRRWEREGPFTAHIPLVDGGRAQGNTVRQRAHAGADSLPVPVRSPSDQAVRRVRRGRGSVRTAWGPPCPSCARTLLISPVPVRNGSHKGMPLQEAGAPGRGAGGLGAAGRWPGAGPGRPRAARACGDRRSPNAAHLALPYPGYADNGRKWPYSEHMVGLVTSRDRDEAGRCERSRASGLRRWGGAVGSYGYCWRQAPGGCGRE